MNIVTDIEFMRKYCRPTSQQEIEDNLIHEKLMESLDSGYREGLGLAANQIGYRLRYAVYVPSRIAEGKVADGIPVRLLNPRIIERHDLKPFRKEGCLSMPDVHFTTWRYTQIVVEYDRWEHPGTEQRRVSGIEAVVVQHEIDHMDGVLCRDRVKKPEVTGPNDPCECGSGKKFKKCHGKETS